MNLFLLLPETSPLNAWIRSTVNYEAADYNVLYQELKESLEAICVEDYQGFYDSLNVRSCFVTLDSLDHCYPLPQKRAIESLILKNFTLNWRNQIIQELDSEYTVFGQQTSENTFCEIAERKCQDDEGCYVLLNNQACTITNSIDVNINGGVGASFDNLIGTDAVVEWFSINRLPQRNFHTIDKHGENRQDIRVVNGEVVSPLRCSCERAQSLLLTAIGSSINELYCLDSDYDEIIVFMYEGANPQNMYHGFHVPIDSPKVTQAIRQRLVI